MIQKLNDVRKTAFDKLGEFLNENGFEAMEHARLLRAGSIYGFMFDYKGNMGPLYDQRVIIVGLDNVYLLGRNTPYNYSRWEIISDYNYSSKKHLLILLEELLLGSKNAKEVW